MKYVFTILLFISFVIGGCIALEPAQQIVAEMAARRVAYHVGIADGNQDLIESGIEVCDLILQTNDSDIAQPILLSAIDVAISRIDIDDPFIAQDIMSIMKLLGINRDGELDKELDLTDVKLIATAIKQGLMAAKVKLAE